MSKSKAALIGLIGISATYVLATQPKDTNVRLIAGSLCAIATAGGIGAALRSGNNQYGAPPQRTHRYQTPLERGPEENLPIERQQLHLHLTQDRRTYFLDNSTHNTLNVHNNKDEQANQITLPNGVIPPRRRPY